MDNIKKLISYSKAGILSKVLLKTEKGGITLFSMFKNTDISEHTSTKKGFILVLEGKGHFKLQGKDILMEKDTIIFFDKNAVHSIRAKENMSFLLFLVD